MFTKQILDEDFQYEMLQAISQGEIGIARFLNKLIGIFENTKTGHDSSIEEFKKQFDEFIEEYRVKDGKDGKHGEKGEQGEAGRDGRNGKDGRDGRDGVDGIDGFNGKDGKDGKDGNIAKMPKHEWDGSKIRFEKDVDEWGPWVDLKGQTGPAGMAAGPSERGSGGGLEKVRGTNFLREGVTEIVFGNNLTVTRTPNGVRVDAQAGGTGGINTEEPVGYVDGINNSYTVSNDPKFLVIDSLTYFEGFGFTYSAPTITVDSLIAPTQFIRSVY